MNQVLDHFRLQALPFTRAIASGDLYRSEALHELLARLHYAVNSRAFMLLTGQVGAGKTSALRALRDELDPSLYRFIYLADSRLTPASFYEHLLTALGVAPPRFLTRLKRCFRMHLVEMVEQRHLTPVVVIDEGHNLTPDMLQELRFILNFHLDSCSLFPLILAGQPELRTSLKLLTLAAVAQRLDLKFHLDGLSLPETRDYLQHHLRVAGCDRPLYTEEVLAKIHAHTKGIPRLVNRLALAALLDAASRHDQLVEDAHLGRALADLAP